MKQYRQEEQAKIKERASGQRWYKRNPDIAKNAHLKRKFNISIEDYNKMLTDQNGTCAICSLPETKKHHKGKVADLAVDHCHKSGKVRGLLCWTCNASLGKFKDSTELLQKAIDYLNKTKEAT